MPWLTIIVGRAIGANEPAVANHRLKKNDARGRTRLVDKQLADLEAAAGAIEHYVDRRIAHYDKRDLATPVPSFKDLEDALRALETLVIFYWAVLKGSGLVGLTPTIQYDWQDVFEFAWIERREADDAGPNDQLERDLRSAR